jgi:hypothetical protein
MLYLGQLPDGQRLTYDPDDLTTHGLCVGMTGSGKTGLCLVLLEEAALAGVPAIVIDPKGDIANVLLQFPELRAEDFRPWVGADEARRARLTLDELAARTAERWRAGLAESGLGPDDVARLKASADWAVYTPGSDAGRGISVLSSLRRPALSWDTDAELLRERINGIVSGLLGLIGVDADPVRSREHILLATLFEQAWRAGNELDLASLIAGVQAPPFDKLGVFEVDRFFPEKDRMALAMNLNAIVAAPSFQSWLTGEPLEIDRLLYTSDGRPRVSVLYLAHLSEAERMFVITLVLEQLTAWLRAQSGTTALRALLYFDELFGYLPPHPANPPSKQPLLRLIKQARAFGLGMMLATQNPVDLDYKGLANIGTWFIGKLQTERDKDRLLEGLQALDAPLSPETLDKMISGLGQRQFLMHNVHQPGPTTFHTRWALSYLAGPLTRDQLRRLRPPKSPAEIAAEQTLGVAAGMAAAETGGPAAEPARFTVAPAATPTTARTTVVSVPTSIPQYLVKPVGERFRPSLFAQVVVRYSHTRANLSFDKRVAYSVPVEAIEPTPQWDAHGISPLPLNDLSRALPPRAWIDGDPGPLTDPRKLATWQKDLTAALYRNADLLLHQNPTLKLYAKPGEAYAEFRARCHAQADARRADELRKAQSRYDRQLDTLEGKLYAERRERAEDEAEVRSREGESRWTDLENVLGLVGLLRQPQRMITTSLSRRRLKDRSQADLSESAEQIALLESRINALKAEARASFQVIIDKWAAAAVDIHELRVTPRRADILVEAFGIGWV